jgi:hypothetical protein
LDL